MSTNKYDFDIEKDKNWEQAVKCKENIFIKCRTEKNSIICKLLEDKNKTEMHFNFVEKYGWPKIIHQFTLKILFLIKNLLKVTLFSVKFL